MTETERRAKMAEDAERQASFLENTVAFNAAQRAVDDRAARIYREMAAHYRGAPAPELPVGTEFDVTVATGGLQDDDGIIHGDRMVRRHARIAKIGRTESGERAFYVIDLSDGRTIFNDPQIPAYPLDKTSVSVLPSLKL